ncbi:putative transcription factor C2H2 family [Lupinus albus]|uniref:RING-type E3 ubiquitin transferase n=1 Tax=Lupinus albus TaxID=3870 RepID=A0A6A4Q657_LUPAL|nr:putative transcription factor C2H2 family [Lupinus albus]
MKWQRGAVGSMSETFEFHRDSTSSNATMDQQIFWNNVRNTAENQVPEYILSPSDINSVYVNSINHEWQNLSGWSLGEPSSSNTANEINNDEQKRELGWSSPINAGALSSPRVEERRLEPTNALSLDNVNTGPIYMCSSNSHLISQNLNSNSDIADNGSDNSQQRDRPNLPKSSGSVNEHIPPSIGSGAGSFLIPQGNNDFLAEDTDGRSGCSLGTSRVCCKRKAVERNAGQSSDGGSSSYIQQGDGSAWHPFPTQDNAQSSLSMTISVEQLNARLGLGMGDGASESVPDSYVAGISDSLHKNFRLRINPSNPQNSTPPTAFIAGNVIRHSGASTSSTSQRFHPVDSSMYLRAALPIDNMIPPSQPPVTHAPALPRNRQSYRWSGGSSSRNILSSNSIICPDRDNLPQDGASSGSMSRNAVEHPVFAPATDLGNLAQHPAISGSSSSIANLSIPGNVASSSPTAFISATNPSSASTWASYPNLPQHPRRLPGYVRRSLFPPASEATGGPSNNLSVLRPGPFTSEPRVLSTGAHPRSALRLERRGGNSEFGIPHSLRDLAVTGEGSSRVVSELRNVLGRMRRGGNLQFEDVMILDQSVFSRMANIHDRHQDMRLDVDNMSYEELLALEERIGNVSTGLSEDTILKLLKQKKYVAETGPQLDADPCCVCQENYGDGDDTGRLDCGHDFHSNCIKQWLMHKNLCPICKTTGLAT